MQTTVGSRVFVMPYFIVGTFNHRVQLQPRYVKGCHQAEEAPRFEGFRCRLEQLVTSRTICDTTMCVNRYFCECAIVSKRITSPDVSNSRQK